MPLFGIVEDEHLDIYGQSMCIIVRYRLQMVTVKQDM